MFVSFYQIHQFLKNMLNPTHKIIAIALCLTLITACNSKTEQKRVTEPSDTIDTQLGDSSQLAKIQSMLTIENTAFPNANFKPMQVAGDWDGQNRIDTLRECFFSKTLNREVISPLYQYGNNDNVDYDELVDLAVKLDPTIYIVNKNRTTDSIVIGTTPQLFGLYILDNKGDLDGDGGDELIVLVNYADWSSTNTCYIYSRKNDKWIELYNFLVWEWQLDEEEEMITKLPNNKIKIRYRNDESMLDTKIVDLRKKH